MNRQSGDQEARPGRGPRRSGLGSRRVRTVAFGLSLLIHLVLISLYQSVRTPASHGPRVSEPPPAVTPDGLEVLRIVELSTPVDPDQPEDPEELEDLEAPAISPAPVDVRDARPVEIPLPPPTGADRLRPRLTVEELWRPVDPTISDLSLEQREELQLSSRIAEFYDSLAAVEDFNRKFTDWTYTDSEGRRWGVADGRIYLGDVVLPGQHFFAVPTGRRDEFNRLLWEWDQMQLQRSRAEVTETWKERQQAIRERRDRERAARPDTTRTRR